jgi:hypothetical protein
MKLRTKTLHRRPIATPPKVANAEPEVDYTAEGSPPPGKVGAGHPVLPAVEQGEPADTGSEATHGKR